MKTILIVEDSPVQLELLRRALEGGGYQVIAAKNGAEGLAMAKEHRPAEPEDLIRGLNTGADGYLTKPYQTPALVSRMESLLANPPSPPPKTERRVANIATVIGAGKTS